MNRIGLFACLVAAAGCGRERESQTKQAAPAPRYYRPDPANAASLRGVVRFLGRKPPAKPISMDAEEACQKLHAKPAVLSAVVTSSSGGLANVFVYIKSGLEDKEFEPPKTAAVLDQRGCLFVPRVLALQAGQTLVVRNSDPVSHNVHPAPRNNREWNQQQPPGAPDLARRFTRAEVMIPVKCNVHSWMRSYIGVLDHPYFAVTGPDGKFELTGAPSGRYAIGAWHETLGELTELVTLDKGSSATVSFLFRSGR